MKMRSQVATEMAPRANATPQARTSRPRTRDHEDDERQWRAFQQVVMEAIECAIDQATLRVVRQPEDVRALEHLREVARERFAGRAIAMRIPDLLQALGVMLGALADRGGARSEAEPEALALAGHHLATAAHRLRHLAAEAESRDAETARAPCRRRRTRAVRGAQRAPQSN
jgi:hypothetical protein